MIVSKVLSPLGLLCAGGRLERGFRDRSGRGEGHREGQQGRQVSGELQRAPLSHGEPWSWEGPADAARIEPGATLSPPHSDQSLDAGIWEGMPSGRELPLGALTAGGGGASQLMGGSGC